MLVLHQKRRNTFTFFLLDLKFRHQAMVGVQPAMAGVNLAMVAVIHHMTVVIPAMAVVIHHMTVAIPAMAAVNPVMEGDILAMTMTILIMAAMAAMAMGTATITLNSTLGLRQRFGCRTLRSETWCPI